ncbi:MAG: tRNA uridine-5-carboxymethylaminomethyl(34) synthesis GTPase MnmE [Oscillospiraceae bacterium]|nr:tRNA uridine-5-carboxymethylaminomethyl(34) synthesis GTPase MnmE [Oscillospiraceae bacterium]
MIGTTKEKTIAAIATGQSPGGIGIIRISGSNARQVADKVFRAKNGKLLAQAKGYTAHYGHVYDGDTQLDEAIALVFAAPASFTGEDVVELSCHGGLVILKNVLRAVLSAGASAAGPGEFTKRAFLNGKMGLTEAESVMALISANGNQAARLALASHDGALEKRITALREKLIHAAAHLSAWADYPEEEIPEVDPVVLGEELYEAETELQSMIDQFDAGRAIREGVDTVIAGRPNVGKSTLMNLLSGCERSIVTQYAGTTRDIVEETVLLGDVTLRLADTAGIRMTDDPVEQIGVTKAKNRVASAQLVLAVFDSTQPLNDEDRELIASAGAVPSVAIVNKSDLEHSSDLAELSQHFSHVVKLSAKEGSGLRELEDAVAHVLHTSGLDPSEGILFTERQRDVARRSLASVEEALTALNSGMTLDAVTVSLEGAISDLLELTGERATEAVVDSVFAQFCVGK